MSEFRVSAPGGTRETSEPAMGGSAEGQRADPTRVTGPDPRAMLIISLGLTVACLATPGLVSKTAFVLGLLVIWLVLRIGVRKLLLVLTPLTFFMVMTFVLRAVVQAEQYADATHLGPVPFSATGLLVGAALGLQVCTIVLALSAAIFSNPPLVLSEATEQLLKPLEKIRVPVHEGALMFSIALRFIPIMVVEFQRLAAAQAARGAALANRNVFSRLQVVVPLVVPLFVVTLIRARELSEAIESRGYAGASGRTWTMRYRLTPRDYALAAWAGLVIVGGVALAFFRG